MMSPSLHRILSSPGLSISLSRSVLSPTTSTCNQRNVTSPRHVTSLSHVMRSRPCYSPHLVISRQLSDQADRSRDNGIRHLKPRHYYENQKKLFNNPQFFDTPVLMIHCQWTDFAVSLHEPDKLDELDCFWSCFPSDLQIYGSHQRKEKKTIQLIMARARVAMKEHGSKNWRIVFKGHQRKSLITALEYFNKKWEFNFLSITDMSRKLGEESIVYQRPVPRYPVYKKPVDSIMDDGPEWTPTTLLDKFRKLNVTYLDTCREKGVGLNITTEGDKASKRGFVLKKSDAVDRRKHAEDDVKSLGGIKHLIK